MHQKSDIYPYWWHRHRVPTIGIGSCPTIVIKHLFHFIGSGKVRPVDTIKNVITLRARSEHSQVKAFPSGCQSNTISKVRNGITDICQVTIIQVTALIQVIECGITGCRVNAFELVSTEIVYRISLLKISNGTGVEIHARKTGDGWVYIGYFVFQSCKISTHTIVETTDTVPPSNSNSQPLLLTLPAFIGEVEPPIINDGVVPDTSRSFVFLSK